MKINEKYTQYHYMMDLLSSEWSFFSKEYEENTLKEFELFLREEFDIVFTHSEEAMKLAQSILDEICVDIKLSELEYPSQRFK